MISHVLQTRTHARRSRFVVPPVWSTPTSTSRRTVTRGYVPDYTPFEANVFVGLCPLYATTTRRRAIVGAARGRRYVGVGYDSSRAGTIRYLDEVVDGYYR